MSDELSVILNGLLVVPTSGTELRHLAETWD